MICVETIRGGGAFETLGHEWDTLMCGAMTRTPFQSLAYQREWWNNCRPDGTELLTIVVRDDERLIAVAPFLCDGNNLGLNGGTEETDYLDLISAAADAPRSWLAVLGELRRHFGSVRIDLHDVPVTSPTRSILPPAARRFGWFVSEAPGDVCPVIDLRDSFDGYLQQLTKKQRHEIRRKMRRCDQLGVGSECVEHVSEVLEAIGDFFKLLASSSREKALWLDLRRSRLMERFALAAADAGRLRLYFLRLGARRVAGLFAFESHGRLWAYNSGFDPSAASVGVGFVLFCRAIEDAIRRGLTIFDFMRGDEAYKYRLGARDTHLVSLRIGSAAS